MQRGIGPVEIRDFKATAGFGLSAVIGGEQAYAGKPEWMEQNGVSLAAYQDQLRIIGAQGVSVLCFAKGKQLLGFIGIARYHQAGRRDDSAGAQSPARKALAASLAIGRKPPRVSLDRPASRTFMAEVLPADKAAQVKRPAGRRLCGGDGRRRHQRRARPQAG